MGLALASATVLSPAQEPQPTAAAPNAAPLPPSRSGNRDHFVVPEVIDIPFYQRYLLPNGYGRVADGGAGISRWSLVISDQVFTEPSVGVVASRRRWISQSGVEYMASYAYRHGIKLSAHVAGEAGMRLSISRLASEPKLFDNLVKWTEQGVSRVSEEREQHPPAGFYVMDSSYREFWSAAPNRWVVDNPRLFGRLAGRAGDLRTVLNVTLAPRVAQQGGVVPATSGAAGLEMHYGLGPNWLLYGSLGKTRNSAPRTVGYITEKRQFGSFMAGSEYALSHQASIYVYAFKHDSPVRVTAWSRLNKSSEGIMLGFRLTLGGGQFAFHIPPGQEGPTNKLPAPDTAFQFVLEKDE